MPQPETTAEACHWHSEEAYWQTLCGHSFEFTDGGPKENGARFCMYCGKPIEVKEQADA